MFWCFRDWIVASTVGRDTEDTTLATPQDGFNDMTTKDASPDFHGLRVLALESRRLGVDSADLLFGRIALGQRELLLQLERALV